MNTLQYIYDEAGMRRVATCKECNKEIHEEDWLNFFDYSLCGDCENKEFAQMAAQIHKERE